MNATQRRSTQAIADDALPADQHARDMRAVAEGALRKRIDSAVALDNLERRLDALKNELLQAHEAHALICNRLWTTIETATDAAIAADRATAALSEAA